MNTTRITLAVMSALVLVLLSLPTPVQATGPEKTENFGPPPIAKLITGTVGRLLVLKSELGVTDSQKTQIRAIMKKHRPEMAPAVRSVVEKRRKLQESVMADTPDQASIRAAAADLGKSIGETAIVASKVVGEARKVLTKEQIDRLGKFKGDTNAAVDRWLGEMAKQ
ncbi:MAG: Spy/CpxP family protein refolding chaperone [Thermodesulfobacteriota bacterium]